MLIYLKNMVGYKMVYFKGMSYDEIRPMFEEEYNKIQTLFKKDIEVEKTKTKRVIEEIILQESFKKLRTAEASRLEPIQEQPTEEPKELSEEELKKMLEIVPVEEIKAEALQVMQDMSKDGLIPTFDMDTKKWPSEGFWGEAALITCYLLNRVSNKMNMIIPYELWSSRRLNLNYLKVCGRKAVVKLLDPKMKTLGDKGIDCIFIGYAEHSKVFRIYDIKPNEFVSINFIIESIDAIFEVPDKKEAINDEINSTIGNNTWVLANFPLGINYFDTYAPVARINTIRLLIALSSIQNLIIHEMDMKITFLNGELDEEVYMRQP
ncbi:zinc finger, CCHC-type containing protein [Tanacetum coccineum]|uniref:Zinc finger, CCHC-type containing protein n=1 Tax=Tanacetum coccineum TaxID=301880 RepID=A0ABQ5CIS7_9ASTR